MIHTLTREEIDQVNAQSDHIWAGIAELMGTCFSKAHPLLDPEVQSYIAQKTAIQCQLAPEKIETFIHGFLIGYCRN